MEAYRQLEMEFGVWAQVENVVCCSSGTAALCLALESLRLPKDTEVVLSDFNMIACARAVTLASLRPVFVDCLDNLLIDPEQVEDAVTDQTRAILATHIYGRRCNMEALHEIAKKHDLYVVEDLAEAHGVKPHPKTDASAYSFYRNKIVAGEEGGAVAFRCLDAAVLASQLRSLGFTDQHDFWHIPRGHNYRMSNCHAELILRSLKEVEENIWKRGRIANQYWLETPSEWVMPNRIVNWVYDIRIPGLGYEKLGEVVRELNREGIAARSSFKPMHLQAEYRDTRRVGGENAVRLSKEVLYLPVCPGKTTEEEIKHSSEVIKRMVGYSSGESAVST